MPEQSTTLPLRSRHSAAHEDTDGRNPSDVASHFASTTEDIATQTINQPSNTGSEQKKASSKDSNEEDFATLSVGLDQIFSPSGSALDTKTYMHFYTFVHRMLERMRASSPLDGQVLYDFIESYLQTHVRHVRADILAQAEDGDGDEDGLITAYLTQWRAYVKAAKRCAHVLGLFDRHWVMREVDEGKKGVLDMYSLHLMLWKTEVLQARSEALLEILEKRIEGREVLDVEGTREPFVVVQHPSQEDEIREVRESFVAVGVKEAVTGELGEEISEAPGQAGETEDAHEGGVSRLQR